MTKYWAFIRSEVEGPFTKDELLVHPDVTKDTLITPTIPGNGHNTPDSKWWPVTVAFGSEAPAPEPEWEQLHWDPSKAGAGIGDKDWRKDKTANRRLKTPGGDFNMEFILNEPVLFTRPGDTVTIEGRIMEARTDGHYTVELTDSAYPGLRGTWVDAAADQLKRMRADQSLSTSANRSPNMSWNFNLQKSSALEVLQRMSTKGMDPLQDDSKAVMDIASTAAGVASSDPAKERYLADLYNKSDMSQGMDRNSDLYNHIKEEADASLQQVKNQLAPIITKYPDQGDRDRLTGDYKESYIDTRFNKVKDAWEEIRPSQTVNPAPGQQAAPVVAPGMAPAVARRSL